MWEGLVLLYRNFLYKEDWQLQLSINLRQEQTLLFERALISYSVATGVANVQALEHKKITPGLDKHK